MSKTTLVNDLKRDYKIKSGGSLHIFNIILLALMVVDALKSVHVQHSAWPSIDTSRILAVHVSSESPSNIYPNPSEVISEVSEP